MKKRDRYMLAGFAWTKLHMHFQKKCIENAFFYCFITNCLLKVITHYRFNYANSATAVI